MLLLVQRKAIRAGVGAPKSPGTAYASQVLSSRSRIVLIIGLTGRDARARLAGSVLESTGFGELLHGLLLLGAERSRHFEADLHVLVAGPTGLLHTLAADAEARP